MKLSHLRLSNLPVYDGKPYQALQAITGIGIGQYLARLTILELKFGVRYTGR
jgi:hypothetical protein